jgi:hypothetical protein
VGRRRAHSVRFALAVALTALVAALAATVAHALAFDDAVPCRDTQPLFVCPEGTVELAYSIQFVGRGGCGPDPPNLGLPYQYRVINGALPQGLSLSKSGLLSGTPTTAGDYKFWVELSDEDPPSQAWCLVKKAEREFQIVVRSRVLVTTESAAGGTVGVPYDLALSAAMKTGPASTAPPPTPFTWTITQGELPPGLSLDASTGVVSGTPTSEGAFLVTFKAALADGRSDTKALEIVVRQPLAIAASRPLATPPAPTVWEISVPFAAKLTPSGGSGTYTFSMAQGELPTGIVLAADGTLAGRPRVAGVFRATLRLADNEGRTLDYAANFVVAQKLAVSTLALRQGKVGRAYRARLKASGGVNPKTWRVAKGPLPRGIRLDRRLGILSGAPTRGGSYRVTFEVRDGLKVVAKKTLRIVVLP